MNEKKAESMFSKSKVLEKADDVIKRAQLALRDSHEATSVVASTVTGSGTGKGGPCPELPMIVDTEDTATGRAGIGDVIEPYRSAKAERREKTQEAAMEKYAGITSLDWKKIPPPLMAKLIMATPQRGSAGEPDYYLTEWQAYRFAIRAYELGLSPLSTEVWYNPRNNMTNVTFEGKLKLARGSGTTMGPPKFEHVYRPQSETVLKTLPKLAPAGNELGLKCTVNIYIGPHKEQAEYTAWISEWYVFRSPVWREKPGHMLQVRAHEKCISFASGVGASELPDERDMGGNQVLAGTAASNVEATEFVPAPEKIYTSHEKEK